MQDPLQTGPVQRDQHPRDGVLLLIRNAPPDEQKNPITRVLIALY
eukprot:gene4939-6707_t